MSSDLVIIGVLVSLVLGFASVLLFISLTSQGVVLFRVVRILIELWLTFIVIIVIFATITQSLGTTPSGSLIDEVNARLHNWRQLTGVQQSFIVAGLVLAVGLFAHIVWAIGDARKNATGEMHSPRDGEDTQ